MREVAFRRLMCSVLIVLFLVALPTAGLAKVINLKWAHCFDYESSLGALMEEFQQEIVTRTNGQIKFSNYWSGSLVPAPDTIDAVKTGLADIGTWTVSFVPGKAPIWEVSSLPYLSPEDMHEGYAAAWKLVDSVPEFKTELANFNQKLWFINLYDHITLLTKKPIKSADQLKGMKIRGYGYYLKFFDRLGATMVYMPKPEVFDALQKGTIDGQFTCLNAIASYGYHQVTPYVLIEPIGMIWDLITTINSNTWSKLPPDIQRVFEDIGRKHREGKAADFVKKLVSEHIKKMQAEGATLTHLSREESSRWRAQAPLIWEVWIKDMEKRDIPGKRTLGEYQRLIESRK